VVPPGTAETLNPTEEQTMTTPTTPADFFLLRSYPDGSTVFVDEDGRMYFCADRHDEPTHSHVPCAGGMTAARWLTYADAKQSAAD